MQKEITVLSCVTMLVASMAIVTVAPLSRHYLWSIITSGGQRFGKVVLAFWPVPFGTAT